MENNEQNRIKRILAGETSLYGYFLETYSRQVFNLLASIVTHTEEAQELTQDVFLKAFRHLSSFKGECAFSTWLYSIAYHTGMSAIRRRKFETVSLDEVLLSRLTDDEVNEMLADEDEQRMLLLDKALEHLSPDERTLIRLFYREDRSIRDIAQISGLSESATKVKLHRIRKKICIFIKQEEDGRKN